MHNSATFAFNLAKEQAATSGIDISLPRNQLEKEFTFKDLFTQAKKRVFLMRMRIVEIENSVMQILFEVYAALEFKTPYNDFDSH